jgi:hypothetical protein
VKDWNWRSAAMIGPVFGAIGGAFHCVGAASGFYGEFAAARSSMPFGRCLTHDFVPHFFIFSVVGVLFLAWLTRVKGS